MFLADLTQTHFRPNLSQIPTFQLFVTYHTFSRSCLLISPEWFRRSSYLDLFVSFVDEFTLKSKLKTI